MWTRRRVAAVLAVAVMIFSGAAVVLVATSTPVAGLLPFHTYGEFAQFVGQARSSANYGGALFGGFRSTPIAGPAAPVTGAPGGPSAPSYSETNVQVTGVDEMDRVKTDGAYIYLISQDEAVILEAYPASDLHVVSRIALEPLVAPIDGNVSVLAAGLFLDGGQLAVIATSGGRYGPIAYGPPVLFGGNPVLVPGTGDSIATFLPQRTFLFLFDVTDQANPRLEHTVAITGMPSAGRMVGGTVYLVATQWLEGINGTYVLPQTCVERTCQDMDLGRIYHDPQSADAWDYTNLLAVDTGSGASSAMSIVTGGYSTLYMSPTALYLSFFKWQVSPAAAGPMMMPVRMGASWTTIYKLRADGLDVEAVASADVPGSLLSQYSLDEWNGYLRVATTVREFTTNTSTVRNDVYVFDGAMRLVGSLKGLAPGESIFSVRFLGDTGYVVTFRKIDPLFVIDLSDPTAPTVIGVLEMPGFSDYLHPLDAGHLLGVGKDALPAEGNFSWYQGLKLSLYDVTDPTHPAETSNVTIGDRGTNSAVLQDPHAFLSVPDRELVVLPVDLAKIDPSQYPEGVPPYAWGNLVWQGVYVYHVNATSGFQLVGRIAHGNGTVNTTYGWYGSPTEIRRSLYIGDVLYTISDTEVLASSLADLSPLASVTYATAPTCPYCVPGPVPVAVA